MSFDVRKFIKTIKKEFGREGNHFMLPLLLRDLDKEFSNNRKMAKLRLYNLKERFKHDEKFNEDCKILFRT